MQIHLQNTNTITTSLKQYHFMADDTVFLDIKAKIEHQ